MLELDAVKDDDDVCALTASLEARWCDLHSHHRYHCSSAALTGSTPHHNMFAHEARSVMRETHVRIDRPAGGALPT